MGNNKSTSLLTVQDNFYDANNDWIILNVADYPQRARIVVKYLRLHRKTKKLCLKNNRLFPRDICTICSYFVCSGSLQSLDLSTNYLGHGSLRLSEFLSKSRAIEDLFLNWNRIGEAQILLLARGLTRNQSLRVLSLAGNRLGGGIDVLVDALLGKTNLQKLDLSWNNLGLRGANALARMLEHESCGLIELNIGGNLLGLFGARELARSLRLNRTLQRLSLWHNQMCSQGTSAFFRELQNQNQSLRELDLTGNRIGREGVQSIAIHLEQSRTVGLQTLNLAKTQLDDMDAVVIAQSLMLNHRLEYLGLTSMNITDVATFQSFADMLPINSTLKVLELADCNMGNGGMRRLAQGLKRNQTLQELDLNSNSILEDGIFALVVALQQKGSAIRRLNLWSNPFGQAGIQALTKAAKTNNQLVQCHVDTYLLGMNNTFLQELSAQLYLNRKSLHRLVVEDTTAQLLPRIIGAAGSQQYGLDLIYALLRARPDLFKAS